MGRLVNNFDRLRSLVGYEHEAFPYFNVLTESAFRMNSRPISTRMHKSVEISFALNSVRRPESEVYGNDVRATALGQRVSVGGCKGYVKRNVFCLFLREAFEGYERVEEAVLVERLLGTVMGELFGDACLTSVVYCMKERMRGGKCVALKLFCCSGVCEVGFH